eukprot:5721278-Pyramimonas_sp.AAC.1
MGARWFVGQGRGARSSLRGRHSNIAEDVVARNARCPSCEYFAVAVAARVLGTPSDSGQADMRTAYWA